MPTATSHQNDPVTRPPFSSCVDGAQDRSRSDRIAFANFNVEPMTGIDPAYSAWEAG